MVVSGRCYNDDRRLEKTGGIIVDYYKQIFKRKSFHIFKGTGILTDTDIQKCEEFIRTIKPLISEIKTEICIVPENETTCKRGGQYCILQ